MGLTIRPATAADEAVLVAFNAALALETEHKTLRPDVLGSGVRAVFADPARGFYTVAQNEGGEVVAQMMVTFEWSDWRNGWFWWVQSVYVRPDARRSGAFRSLYREVERRAAADPGVIGIRLYVERENARARATYRALGMAETTYGVMEEYPLPGRASDIG
ncbi:GNAT family N-acetyltransferase [Gemmata sp.]|uniref:GNAT family N-acetyltransferase n=1 Tax=Gemmata sp. TaxID=1914242 RepID=UPI003F6FAE6A